MGDRETMDNRNNNGTGADDFEYTVVLDENYNGPELNASGEELNELLAFLPDKNAENEAERKERLYRDYEKMCFREPTVLDMDDIYPHSYQWRGGDRYDQGKLEALEEAIKKGIKVADTEAYQRYIEEVRHRRFSPVSWD